MDVNFPVPIVVVVHRMKNNNSSTADILQYRSKVHIHEALDKTEVLPGKIYIAPADYHLLIDDQLILHMDCSAPLNYSRPSIDIFFESVAYSLGKSAAGILLTGANSDGANGLAKMKKAGCVTVVEDPETAEFNAMPLAATKLFKPDFVCPANEIIDLILSVQKDE